MSHEQANKTMMVPELLRRAGRFAWWRGYARWAHPLADRLAVRWGRVTRLVRWPLPWMAPYRQANLDVTRNIGLGDVLMCTPVLREVKRRNPDCRITLYTNYPDPVEGLSFIDRVRPASEQPDGVLWLNYERSIPPRRHIARIFGDQLGIDVRDVRPSCAVREDLVERFRRDWSGLPRPLVVVNRFASSWTPNKDWPDEFWDDLVARLAARATIIEVGGQPLPSARRPDGNYLDLRGRTTLPELIAAMAAADLHIAPVTGTVHIAAAMGVPSVVIYGGYEHPDGSSYPGNISLYSSVECAPCWLRTPCPYGKMCLQQITPDQVEAAVDRLWANASGPSLAGNLRDAPRDRAPADAATTTDPS
jgi:hypothetical protein